MPTDLWSGYWQDGDVESSTGEFSADARNRIGTRWMRFFTNLPDKSSVLDLGTGGGALLAMAAKSTDKSHRLSLTGVDLATTRPPSAPQSSEHCDITYRGGVSVEKLPFEDNCFTAVISQFAIEYGDLEQALREAARVAKHRFRALIHASEGVVVRQNGPIADQIRWLLDELELVDLLARHVRKPTAENKRSLNAAGGAISVRCRELENPSFLQALAANVGQFLAQHHQYSGAQKQRILKDFESHLENHAERMQALARAARSRVELIAAGRVFTDAGFQRVECGEQRSNQDRHLVGYWLTADLR